MKGPADTQCAAITDGVHRRALRAVESGAHSTGEAAAVGSMGQAPCGGSLCTVPTGLNFSLKMARSHGPVSRDFHTRRVTPVVAVRGDRHGARR